jgi:transcriptional pleiotropic regulator of transition state genes
MINRDNIKATGIVRKIDSLGRIVIPRELRRTLDLMDENAPLEIYTEEGFVVLKKYVNTDIVCAMCGAKESLTPFKETYICSSCVGELFDTVRIDGEADSV